jgi:TolB-like protein/DNA-binding winged helix-turn-helix (wHTH) protein/tetratricopeptide (TPR) repeat protein
MGDFPRAVIDGLASSNKIARLSGTANRAIRRPAGRYPALASVRLRTAEGGLARLAVESARQAEKKSVSRPVEATQLPQPAGYCVDDLIIDLGRRRVTRGPAEIPLPGLSFDLLLALVRGAPNLLSTEQLMDRVWPGLVVNPETVSQRIKLVRAALGDDPQAPRYIASVRGRGYRLLPPVVLLSSPRVLASAVADSPKDADSSAAPPLREPQNAPPAGPGARWPWTVSAVAATALLVAGGAALLTQMSDRDATRSIAIDRPSMAQSTRTIAVLPFVNAGGDPDLEYLSDSLTEELLERLSDVPELQVAARTSSFYFKNRADDVQQAGRMLRVGHVVKGSVRRQGENIRVTVQLISTENGYRHWSNEYDRHISEILAIEQEIVQSVVDSLRLGPIQRGAGVRSYRSTSSPEAYELYLRARRLYQSFQLDRMDRAIAYYEGAIRLDPTFADAYVGLADALGWRRLVGGMPPTDPVTARIAALLRKALDLDPSSGDAHALLGKELMFTYDFKGAERELQRAEALSPNGDYVVASIMAYYMLVGWPAERAIGYARKGRQLDPLNPWAVIHVAQAHWHAHQYHEALIELERVFEIEPDFWLAHLWRAMILTDLERYREALPAALRAVELNQGADAFALSVLAVAHINLGEIDEAHAVIARIEARGVTKGWHVCLALKDYQCALADLEQTFAERDRFFPESLHYRAMLPLHGEPRFQRLVRLVGQERRVEQAARLNNL